MFRHLICVFIRECYARALFYIYIYVSCCVYERVRETWRKIVCMQIPKRNVIHYTLKHGVIQSDLFDHEPRPRFKVNRVPALLLYSLTNHFGNIQTIHKILSQFLDMLQKRKIEIDFIFSHTTQNK